MIITNHNHINVKHNYHKSILMHELSKSHCVI